MKKIFRFQFIMSIISFIVFALDLEYDKDIYTMFYLLFAIIWFVRGVNYYMIYFLKFHNIIK